MWRYREKLVSCLFLTLQILPQLKTFFFKSKCAHHPCTRRHLWAKFDIFRPSQSWDIVWRKITATHPDRHPAYFTIWELQYSALRNFVHTFQQLMSTQSQCIYIYTKYRVDFTLFRQFCNFCRESSKTKTNSDNWQSDNITPACHYSMQIMYNVQHF